MYRSDLARPACRHDPAWRNTGFRTAATACRGGGNARLRSSSPPRRDDIALRTPQGDGSRPPQYPQITIYKRKDQGDERLPLYLVEFYAVAHRFMYELPFLEEDSKLTSRDEWRYLFSTIPSFGKIKNWNYDDFSADAEMTLSNNIVFESKNRRVDNA